jgi:hypothetical protein
VRSILLAFAVLTAFAPATAQAAPGFVPQPSMGGGVHVFNVHTAMNARGDLVVVWLQGPTTDVLRVVAAVRPAGGPFGPVQQINDPAETSTGSPDVGIDAQGNAFAIWTGVSQGVRAVRYSKAPAGQPFGAPIVIESGQAENNTTIAVSPAGDLLAAWTFQNNSGATGARADVALPGQALPVKPMDLSPGNPAVDGGPAVAFGPNRHGAVVVALAAPVAGASSPPSVGIATVAPGSGTLTAETGYSTRSGTGPFATPDVAVDGQGRTVAVFRDTNTGTPTSAGVYAAVRPASGGGFAGATELSPGATQPHVAADTAGDFTAVWLSSGGTVQAAPRPASAATADGFGSAQAIDTSSGGSNNPAVGMDPAGTTVVSWDNGGVVHATHSALGGPLFEQALSGSGNTASQPSVTVGGDGAVAWTGVPSGGQPTVGVEAFDDEAPSLSGVAVPATAQVGVPVAMSASVFDVWGPASVYWQFGDGAAALGTSVAHTYAAEGDYMVTLLAFDAAANSASPAPALIHVISPPPPIPTEGVDFNASSVSGTVLVSTPKNAPAGRVPARSAVHAAASIKPPAGYTPFRTLGKDENIPIHSILDTVHGTVSLKMATNAAGTTFQTGKFSKGAFRTDQGKKKALTTVTLMGGGNFALGCRKSSKTPLARAARSRPHRQLFSNVHGSYRGRGRSSAATVGGTEYLIKDTCSGTLTVVKRGTVFVRDFAKHRTIVVKKGHRYLARPAPLKKKR